jgi:hypothetical protein
MRHLALTGTAHRPTREERKNKEHQELRRANHHLSREVARLRKQLVKATDARQGFEAEEGPVESARKPDPVPGVGTYCPKCPPGDAPPMRAVSMPFGILLVCPDCKHRVVQRS